MNIAIAVPNMKLLSRQKKNLLPSLINISLFIGPLVSLYWHMVEWFRFLQRIAIKVSRHSCICCCCSERSFCCLTSCFSCVHIKFSRTSGCLSGNKLCFTGTCLTGNTKSRCFKGLCARVLIHGDGLTVIRYRGAG